MTFTHLSFKILHLILVRIFIYYEMSVSTERSDSTTEYIYT